jgi:hypothetical protein
MKIQLGEILDTLMQGGRQEILRLFRKDSCIASVKVACEVLAHHHLIAEPLVVRVMVFNPAFVARIESGADFPESGEIVRQWFEEDGSWTLGIGYGERQPNSWPGHLVAVLREQRLMIDLSLDQACRPEKGIDLVPSVFDVQDTFLSGEETLVQEINGSVVKYNAFPDDRSYRISPNWTNPRPDELELSRTIVEMIGEKP